MTLTKVLKQKLKSKFGADAIVEIKGDYHFLSNFSDNPVAVDGASYKTAEHAFQAQKTTDAGERARVAAAPTSNVAKAVGRQMLNGPHRTPGWFSGVRDEAMRKTLAAKVRRRVANVCSVRARSARSPSEV